MTGLGLMLPQMRMDFPTMVERARAAEGSGWSSVWLMDHMAPPGGPALPSWEAWTTATWLAAHTSTIRVGHLVLCEAFRHPALLAHMAASLDHASGGRLDLGIGWGSVPPELAAWGFGTESAATGNEVDPPAVRSRRLDEALTVMRALWDAGNDPAGPQPVTHHGEFFHLDGVVSGPGPLQDPLPVLIGGAGEHLTLPLVARHAQLWNCPAYAADRLTDMIASLRAERGDLHVTLQVPLGVVAPDASTEDRAEVERRTQQRFGFWGRCITGVPDEVTAELAALADAGVDTFIAPTHDFGEPSTLELIGETVIPALR